MANLEILVSEYLKSSFSCEPCYAEFEKMSSDTSAIKIACRSETTHGRRHTHQRRIPGSVLAELEKSLLDDLKSVKVCRNFDDLYSTVTLHCDKIKGAGPLLAYDVALRIGQGYLKFEPEFVYLHAGAKDGARKIGINTKKVAIDVLPIPFHALSPAQAEDFFCRFKDRISNQ